MLLGAWLPFFFFVLLLVLLNECGEYNECVCVCM